MPKRFLRQFKKKHFLRENFFTTIFKKKTIFFLGKIGVKD